MCHHPGTGRAPVGNIPLPAGFTPPPCQSAATVNATGPCGQPACGSGHVHRGGPPHVGPSSVINGAGGQPTGTNSHTRITWPFLTVITTRTDAEDPRGAGTVNATDTILPDGPSDVSSRQGRPWTGNFQADPSSGIAWVFNHGQGTASQPEKGLKSGETSIYSPKIGINVVQPRQLSNFKPENLVCAFLLPALIYTRITCVCLL